MGAAFVFMEKWWKTDEFQFVEPIKARFYTGKSPNVRRAELLRSLRRESGYHLKEKGVAFAARPFIYFTVLRTTGEGSCLFTLHCRGGLNRRRLCPPPLYEPFYCPMVGLSPLSEVPSSASRLLPPACASVRNTFFSTS